MCLIRLQNRFPDKNTKSNVEYQSPKQPLQLFIFCIRADLPAKCERFWLKKRGSGLIAGGFVGFWQGKWWFVFWKRKFYIFGRVNFGKKCFLGAKIKNV